MATKKTIEKKATRDTAKDNNLISKKPEEKSKKGTHSVSTPRTFVQKTSAADIYARNNSAVQSVKTPKKTLVPPNARSNVLQTKDILKSSHSTLSQISTKSYRSNKSVNDIKAIPNTARSIEKSKLTSVSSQNMGVIKKMPITNVTVNSPTAKRRSNVDDITIRDKKEVRQEQKKDENYKERVVTRDFIPNKAVLPERKRTKTRTLHDEEIKILTPDVVDNNPDILNLTKNLSAQPKAFFIDLNGKEDKREIQSKSSDEEVSYEDDFESYESDFESYHSSSQTDHSSIAIRDNDSNDIDENDSNGSNELMETGEYTKEKMLDSGNFDLRDPRTYDKTKPMDYIVEDMEEVDKKASLTDEGFQESFSSGLSSMKTLHVDVLERPLFIDFKKSRENRRKQKILERFRQRINDILSMITLHEISYSLCEIKPISYDLYMATFGRLNYTQTAVQTYDDGISEEMQTDEIVTYNKWTQHPIEFSTNYLDESKNGRKIDNQDDFAFLYSNEYEIRNSVDDNDTHNPLRIYLQQRDGAGSDVLPYEVYKSKLKKDDYDVRKLKRFLKKFESRVSYILNTSSGNTISNLKKTSKFPFSNECLFMTTRDLNKEKFLIIKDSPIIGVIFSDANDNLVITIHQNTCGTVGFEKCILCLWDISIANLEPLKIMVAIDHVNIGRFRGSTDGFLVGALNDGSIHLWDLTEEPTWSNSVTSQENLTKMTLNNGVSREIKYNDKKDSNVKTESYALQACAYTTSAINVFNKEIVNSIVGLEYLGECSTDVDSGRKLLAQLCALQSVGILTIWSIIQEKRKNLQSDIGKALWSKMTLERHQTINLINHIDVSVGDNEMEISIFNLITAKKRISKKRSDRFKISRPKSNNSKQDDSSNVTSGVKSAGITDECESNIACSHLKVIKLNNFENFLVAKNRGEVICCRRSVGVLKVKIICVAKPVSFVTCLEISPHGLPYFLAATDCGTVNLCSLLDYRVLLTLDCRNVPSSTTENSQADFKGSYVSSFTVKTSHEHEATLQLPITTVSWLHLNPFVIAATFGQSVVVWELTHSDIRARCKSDGTCCIANEKTLALITKDGDVQFYKLNHSRDKNLELFERYVALL